MTMVKRPWGSYIIMDTGKGFQVKRIEVDPGKRLSLQSHRLRAEHWFAVSGSGHIDVGDNNIQFRKGECVNVPVGVKHRISNTSDSTLVIIEIQTGTAFDEGDIVRYDDDFGRN